MVRSSITLLLCVALTTPFHVTAADPPQTPAELVDRRELWPQQVTLLQGARFQNGRSVDQGQVVVLDEITPDGLKLDDGVMFFMYPADQTDLMERVEQTFASLTPAQLALTMTDVRQQEALWPTRATLRWGLTLDSGVEIPAGQDLVMMGFRTDGRFLAGDVERNVTVPVDPWYTDLFVRARLRVGLDDDAPFSFRLLESMLAPSADGSTIADYDYVVLYDGRDTCARSTAFAPKLAAFQQQSAAEGVSWQLVLINGAAQPAENRDHYRNTGLDGRVVKDGWGQVLYRYFDLGGYQTPWLHVFDASGTQVAVAGEPTSSSGDALDYLVQRVQPSP